MENGAQSPSDGKACLVCRRPRHYRHQQALVQSSVRKSIACVVDWARTVGGQGAQDRHWAIAGLSSVVSSFLSSRSRPPALPAPACAGNDPSPYLIYLLIACEEGHGGRAKPGRGGRSSLFLGFSPNRISSWSAPRRSHGSMFTPPDPPRAFPDDCCSPPGTRPGGPYHRHPCDLLACSARTDGHGAEDWLGPLHPSHCCVPDRQADRGFRAVVGRASAASWPPIPPPRACLSGPFPFSSPSRDVEALVNRPPRPWRRARVISVLAACARPTSLPMA